MDNLSREELQTLAEAPGTPCVSIYLPMHRTAPSPHLDVVQLKDLLRDAEGQLTATGMRSPEARALLQPVEALLDDDAFWSDRGDGLAIFRSPSFFRAFRLPLTFRSLVVVGPRFHVTPLMPMLMDETHFYILALDEGVARLLEATPFSYHEVQIPDPPRGSAPPTTSRGDKGPQVEYFRELDSALHRVLHDKTAPLILAAVEYYFPLYRHANSYRHLLEEGVLGSPAGWSDRELHERARDVMQRYLDRSRQEAAEQYRNMAAGRRASNRLEEVLREANKGRVQFLFLAANEHRWGRFDPSRDTVQVHPQHEPGDEDLLGRVALDTFVNHGKVWTVQADEVPDRAPLAAVFCY
jgi:hypothetical protein